MTKALQANSNPGPYTKKEIIIDQDSEHLYCRTDWYPPLNTSTPKFGLLQLWNADETTSIQDIFINPGGDNNDRSMQTISGTIDHTFVAGEHYIMRIYTTEEDAGVPNRYSAYNNIIIQTTPIS